MPQFTPWAITNPAPNVLFNPAAVDQSIADTQSKLGDLDIRRQQLGIEQQKLDLQRTAGAALLGGLGGDGTGTAPPADSTPFEQQMGAAEGGGTADKVNAGGYAGQFQFGSQRLADLGLYTPAPGEGKNEWKGKFNIAPYNVSTLQDFLGNPAAQHAAFVAHVANIDQAINNTPGADKFDRNGLRAVAHLGGVGGMQAFVQSGGNLNSADTNGTTLKQYYQKFAQGGPAALQQSFGSVHGPGGPPSDLPAVRPGGNVSTAWVDPNAPLPVPPIPPAGGPPPFNPNAGPRVAGAPPALPGAIVPPVTGSDPNAPVQIPPVGQARSGPIPPPPGGSADATPIAPSPIALRTGGTDVAGPGAGPDTTLPAVAAPNQMYQTGIPGITIGGPPSNSLAPPPAAAQSPAGAGVAPTAPGAAPGASLPPGVATRPPPLLPPPAPVRAIPLEPVLPNGLTASQVKIAAAMVAGGTPVADVGAHMAQWRQLNVSNQQQAATQAALTAQANFERQKWYQEQQVQAEQTAYQRQRDAATTPHYVTDPSTGVSYDTSGTHPPSVPPSPRMTVTPSGDVVQAMPGGGVRTVAPADPAAIAARAAAQAQGTGVGGDVAKQLPVLAEQGRNATQAIGNIDYGMNQLNEAAKGGIPSGYFAPWLANVSAAAKSLGFTGTLSALGIDPAAVGNVQSAQKTLGVVSGAILQQAIGQDSQITDAKIQHFIHTQPGIETDPQAVQRVLNWARSQFVYENEMSRAAMTEAASSPTGTLPLNWQARYYRDKGFAPIYDPASHEMQQPDGQAPGRQPPSGPPATAPVNPTARTANTTYQTPKGPMKWTGTGWVAP